MNMPSYLWQHIRVAIVPPAAYDQVKLSVAPLGVSLPVGCICSIQDIDGIPQRLLLASWLYLVVKKPSYRWHTLSLPWSYPHQQS